MTVIVSSSLAASIPTENPHLFTPSNETGFQLGSPTQSGGPSKTLFYIQPTLKYSLNRNIKKKSTFIDLNLSVRGFIDQVDTASWQNDISIRNLSLSVSQKRWRLVAGFQDVVWGETFGLPILDLVNARTTAIRCS